MLNYSDVESLQNKNEINLAPRSIIRFQELEVINSSDMPETIIIFAIKTPNRDTEMIRRLTLNDVLFHKEFKSEFSKFFIEKYNFLKEEDKLPKDLLGEDTITALVSIGIMKLVTLKYMSVSLLQALIMSFFGNPNLYTKIFKEITLLNQKLDWVLGNQFKINTNINKEEETLRNKLNISGNVNKEE